MLGKSIKSLPPGDRIQEKRCSDKSPESGQEILRKSLLRT
jgi:hypothetical protein